MYAGKQLLSARKQLHGLAKPLEQMISAHLCLAQIGLSLLGVLEPSA